MNLLAMENKKISQHNKLPTTGYYLSTPMKALSPELINSIREIKKGPVHSAYQIARMTNYCGKWIKHCGWYPDKQTRLYDRTKGRWEEKKVHEYWRFDDDKLEMGLLKGDLLHYSFSTINEHLHKNREI